MTLSTRLMATVVVASLLPARTVGDDSAALLARFRTEAPQGWARLEKYDDELTYSALFIKTDTFFKENQKVETKSKLTWVRRPDCLRVESQELDGKHEGRTTVAVHTETHLFEVSHAKDGGTSWQLLHAGAIKERTDLLHLLRKFVCIVRPTTSFGSGKLYHLTELAGDSTITFEKARIDDDGIRIDYHTAGIGPVLKKPFETHGFIVFDPANNWAVRSFQFATPEGFRVACVNTFTEPDREGVRRIASMRYNTFAAHGTVSHEIDYESTKTGPATPEQFRLAAFGLPDPLGPLPRRFPTAFVLAAGAVACGVVAFWFRRRARTARLAVTPGPTPPEAIP